MQPGDEVEVYHVSAREPWRGEVVESHRAPQNWTGFLGVRVRGETILFDPESGSGPDGWSLASKHVAKLREMRRGD